ncbi:MAG: hypothetical protein IJ228_03945 [Succinivibrio sp.]|nr:hypothetical protein [Succinivibrio sp.]
MANGSYWYVSLDKKGCLEVTNELEDDEGYTFSILSYHFTAEMTQKLTRYLDERFKSNEDLSTQENLSVKLDRAIGSDYTSVEFERFCRSIAVNYSKTTG